MIAYEYQCQKCGTIQEIYQSLSDNPLKTFYCKTCERTNDCNKVITSMNFKLLDGGWSKDNYDKNIDKVKNLL